MMRCAPRLSLVPGFLLVAAFGQPAFAGNGDALLSLLPTDTRMVIGVDVAGLAASDGFEALYPLAESGPVFAGETLASLLGVSPVEVLGSILIGVSNFNPDGSPPVVVLEHTADPTELDERLTDLTTRRADRFGAPCWSEADQWLCRPNATTIVVGQVDVVTRATALSWHMADRPDVETPLWPPHRTQPLATAADMVDDEDATADDEAPAFDDGSLDDDDAIDRLDDWLDLALPESLAETIANLERGSGVWITVVPDESSPEPWTSHVQTVAGTLRLSDALRLRVRVAFDDAINAVEHRDALASRLTSLATSPELRAIGLAAAIGACEVDVDEAVLDIRADVPAADVEALVRQTRSVLSSEFE